MGDFLDMLEPEVVVAERVEVLSTKKALTAHQQGLSRRREQLEAEFRSMEDELLGKSLEILDATLCFSEITPDTEVPPKQWIEELGEKKAMEKLRIAKASWLATKDAPVAIGVAKGLAVGIIKARATEKGGPRTLNMSVVQMSAPLPQFPEREVDK